MRVLRGLVRVRVFVRCSEGEDAQRASKGGCESKHVIVGE